MFKHTEILRLLTFSVSSHDEKSLQLLGEGGVQIYRHRQVGEGRRGNQSHLNTERETMK